MGIVFLLQEQMRMVDSHENRPGPLQMGNFALYSCLSHHLLISLDIMSILLENENFHSFPICRQITENVYKHRGPEELFRFSLTHSGYEKHHTSSNF